jgi:hypothetical protein
MKIYFGFTVAGDRSGIDPRRSPENRPIVISAKPANEVDPEH